MSPYLDVVVSLCFMKALTVLEHWSGSLEDAQFQSMIFPLMIRPHNSEVLKFSQTSCGFGKNTAEVKCPFYHK